MSAPDTLDLAKTTARPGPFDWYRNINQQERRTFWSCKIGYGLDGMDTQMLSFVVPTLIAMWGITTGEAGLIHTSTLIAFAFGNRPNDSGNPDELAEPGPMNEALAACCAALYRQKPVPMYVQWEIARFLDSDRYPDIPARDVISIEPYWDNEGKLVYLSTDGVVEAIVRDYAGGDAATLGMAAVIGHRDHVKRCIITCRARKVASHAPEGIELPVWYDEQSDQPWTRRRDLSV